MQTGKRILRIIPLHPPARRQCGLYRRRHFRRARRHGRKRTDRGEKALQENYSERQYQFAPHHAERAETVFAKRRNSDRCGRYAPIPRRRAARLYERSARSDTDGIRYGKGVFADRPCGIPREQPRYHRRKKNVRQRNVLFLPESCGRRKS